MADEGTVAVYEANAAEYRHRRKAYDPEKAARFAAGVPEGGRRLDLGCGPGLYAELLGRPLVASDVAHAMCLEARSVAPTVPVVCHDLEVLPFRPGTFAGVWASKCLQHIRAERLPRALGEIQRSMGVGGRFDLTVFRGEEQRVYEQHSPSDDDFPGRLFTWWELEPLSFLLEGAGFGIEEVAITDNTIKVAATRLRSLPDVVGPDMSLLISGLNPSLYAADTGVAYGRPGNRFWPAALAAGLVTSDRRPWDALARHGVGFTDLVKRATVAAAELRAEEFRHGLRRLEHLCGLLRPAAIAFCGITGWRAATGDKGATLGWQARTIGGTPAYVLPNPSGLNAHTSVTDLARHLHTAATGPP